MEFLSSVRNVDGNPLPRGHGKQNGETCWMPLSATETSRQRKIEILSPVLLTQRHISRWSAGNGIFQPGSQGRAGEGLSGNDVEL